MRQNLSRLKEEPGEIRRTQCEAGVNRRSARIAVALAGLLPGPED
jgi:hypothetical protein